MNTEKPKVLLVDDEPQILLSHSLLLRTAGIETVTLKDSREVMPMLEKEKISVIVLDLSMPHLSGTELLSRIRYDFPHISVIIMTATNEIEKAVECIRLGAMDYLVKPVEKSRFFSSINRAVELYNLRNEISSLSKRVLTDELEDEDAFSGIITKNKKMRSIFNYIEAIARSRKAVCIAGETGVGKELFAMAVHNVSRVKGPFIAVNVAGLDDTMFSDTLFGHKKGAYTGADKERKGLIVKASDGTILLDEIGDLNELSQVKLLRLLEEGTYYPLGSDIPEKSNARIIASTNKDIGHETVSGKFRKDLYYRLSAHLIHIPPLRERIEDIPMLLGHFLRDASESLHKKVPSVPTELVSLLSNYYYPGNIRELQAMVFDAVSQHGTGKLFMDSFRDHLKNNAELSRNELSIPLDISKSAIEISGPFPTLQDVNDFLVSEALKRSSGNQGVAASLLGITRQALNKRLIRKKKPS
ncbi:MAG: sigma-54-dependent Fis family transcriptional regulator [Nitrospirae bacterium]|nr:sigma-54-dependent Fis family transcriptional regulator [Nitrospirota bacterium]